MYDKVTLHHGDGGKYTNLLIKEIFYKHFDNDLLVNSLDSSIFEVSQVKLAFTTDSFVVKPLIFSGGDIGKLAVCGTINDLTASGAKPLYLSCAVIIEEGLDILLLENIVESMEKTCRSAGVKIITGDTKVVEKGSADGLYINTSGIGVVQNDYIKKPIKEGDQIIITGGIAEHGTAITVERYQINLVESVKSDCMPLNGIIDNIKDSMENIKIMKDPTRGGLATALNEISELSGMDILLMEESIPILNEVKAINELLGLDPLYLACEGRMILVVESDKSEIILQQIRSCLGCEEASIIGEFISARNYPRVIMKTHIGGKRIIDSLEGDMLPRIC